MGCSWGWGAPYSPAMPMYQGFLLQSGSQTICSVAASLTYLALYQKQSPFLICRRDGGCAGVCLGRPHRKILPSLSQKCLVAVPRWQVDSCTYKVLKSLLPLGPRRPRLSLPLTSYSAGSRSPTPLVQPHQPVLRVQRREVDMREYPLGTPEGPRTFADCVPPSQVSKASP